jgi:hypothetical protein
VNSHLAIVSRAFCSRSIVRCTSSTVLDRLLRLASFSCSCSKISIVNIPAGLMTRSVASVSNVFDQRSGMAPGCPMMSRQVLQDPCSTVPVSASSLNSYPLISSRTLIQSLDFVCQERQVDFHVPISCRCKLSGARAGGVSSRLWISWQALQIFKPHPAPPILSHSFEDSKAQINIHSS